MIVSNSRQTGFSLLEMLVSLVVFSDNQARFTGGAIENVDSDPRISGCTFSANLAGRGGGIYNDGGRPEIVNCDDSWSARPAMRCENRLRTAT